VIRKVVYATNANIHFATILTNKKAYFFISTMDRIKKLKEFLANSPEDNFLRHALALEHIKLGEDETARVLFDEIILKEPSYVGSYYHLAKLYERRGSTEQAIQIYERGMQESKKAGDQHAYNELKSAFEALLF
jgi:tetratricopeptide (TPR) repeat protein